MSRLSEKRSVYKSPNALLRVNVLKGREIRHPVTGDVIERVPAVVAEFGIAGPEYQQVNQLTGEMDTFAEIHGGMYDLDAIADQKIRDGEWTEDIKQAVKRRLDDVAKTRPSMVQKVDYVVPPAPKPWPTYDDFTDADRIVEFAEVGGVLERALNYEVENENREELVAALRDRLGVHPDPDPEPDPVVALDQKPVVEAASGRVVV